MEIIEKACDDLAAGQAQGGMNDHAQPASLPRYRPVRTRRPCATSWTLGSAFKNGAPPSGNAKPLAGKTLAMIFEKPSTRTRVSFEVGIRQFGGDAVILTHTDTQIGRGETIADTARVLSRYVDAIMLRTPSAAKLAELAKYATVPVINGLTDRTHPCQVMADVMTFEEHRGKIAGKTVAWSR